MRAIGMIDIVDALNEAIPGRTCVEAWLGAGHVLFLGFRNSASLPTVPTESDALAEYMLQTDTTDWWIESGGSTIAASTQDRPVAEAAALQLIGRKAVRWGFIQSSLALEIDFEGGFRVVTAPAADRTLHELAWVLRMPDRYYRNVKWDGTLYSKHAEEPCGLEPLDYL